MERIEPAVPGGGADEALESDDRRRAVRAALLPILEEADERNRAIIQGAEDDLQAALREMSDQLSGLLDDQQQARLQREVDRVRPLRSR